MRRTLTALALTLCLGPAHATPSDDVAAEMATYGAIYGLSLGTWASLEADITLRPAAWLTAATTTGGVFGGLALADGLDLSVGQTRLIASTSLWTALDWVLIAGELRLLDEATVWLTFAAAAAGASGSILAITQGVDPSAADISLVNSGGLWMVPAGLLLGFTAHLGTGEHLFRDVLLLNVVGLGTGVALAATLEPSREQVLYLDLGLLAGGVSGGLLGVIAGIASESPEVATGLSLLGMAAGAWIAVEKAGFDGGSAAKPRVADGAALRAVPVPLWVGTW